MKKKIYLLSMIVVSIILLNGCCAIRWLTINAGLAGNTITGSPSWATSLGGSAGASMCLEEINESMRAGVPTGSTLPG